MTSPADMLATATERARELGLDADIAVMSADDLRVMLGELAALRQREAPPQSEPITVTPDASVSAPDICVADVLPVVLDVETTGIDTTIHRVLQIAAIAATMEVCEICNPGVAVPAPSSRVHGLTEQTVAMARDFGSAWVKIDPLAGWLRPPTRSWPLAYNAPFDRAMIAAELTRAGLGVMGSALLGMTWIDPLVIVRGADKYAKGKKLVDACARRGIEIAQAHDALSDARATLELWRRLLEANPGIGRLKLADYLVMQETRRAEQDAEIEAFRKRGSR